MHLKTHLGKLSLDNEKQKLPFAADDSN
jgi:hypothetical protein